MKIKFNSYRVLPGETEIAIFLALILAALLTVNAQPKPRARLVETYQETDPLDLGLLKDKANTFAEELEKDPHAKGVVIFYIAWGEYNHDFCKNRIPTARTQAESAVSQMAQSHGVSPKRIEIIDGYLRTRNELEFWVVPRNASIPAARPTEHVHCECTNIAIAGPDDAFDDERTLYYTANLSGGSSPIESTYFRWRATNAKIVAGQGTQSITVKRNVRSRSAINIELNVEGVNRCCTSCAQADTVKTRIHPKSLRPKQ